MVEEQNKTSQTPIVVIMTPQWRSVEGGDLNQDNDFIVASVDSVRGNDGGASINQWRIHY